MPGRARMAAPVAVACIAVFTGCCCVYDTVGTDVQVTGQPVPAEALRRIEPGRTTKAWLLRALGKPSNHEPLANGVEVLTYHYAWATQERLVVLGAPAARGRRVEQARLAFELRDGIVQRVWRADG